MKATIVVAHPDTGVAAALVKGTEVPGWADKLVHPDDIEGGEPAPKEPSGEPPRAGGGSGLDVWKAHAESLGLVVPDDAKRDDVIALVDQHNSSN